MIKDSAPSSAFGEWDCSTYEEIRDFERSNGEEILEYQRTLSEGEHRNLGIMSTPVDGSVLKI